jgi:NADH:ubiquinone oxidoreductase subunit 3 (subunit A)
VYVFIIFSIFNLIVKLYIYWHTTINPYVFKPFVNLTVDIVFEFLLYLYYDILYIVRICINVYTKYFTVHKELNLYIIERTFFNTIIYKTNSLIELFFYSGVFFCLSLTFLVLCYVIALHYTYAEKASSYECGFDPFSDARDPFHINFYLVAILFILFDIELLYFFPWIISIYLLRYTGFYIFIFFYLIFIACFFYEWKKQCLTF